jgi:catechol 2,3-dioxygenase-like lactoylglutathione lyase family enzyme
MGSATETTIPLFPCHSLAETIEFYRALGFVVTHEQTQPYLYGAVKRGDVELHFARLTAHGAKGGFGACLVIVAAVGPYHRAFADGLRAHYGRVPVAGLPRLTRLQPGHTRFAVFDPSGNMLTYINRDEPDADYSWSGEGQSALIQALDNAVFLRDTYANDAAAAKVLDKALARHDDATPLDRARALATRAELAVALGDAEGAETFRRGLREIALPDEERAAFDDELSAADRLERWVQGEV